MKTGFKLDSFIGETLKDLDKAEKTVLRRVIAPLTKQIRSNIKSKGLVDDGNLLKGVKFDIYRHTVLVGMAPPAFHGLLVELGHTAPNGAVIPGNPYFLPAFQSTKGEIQKKLSEEWF